MKWIPVLLTVACSTVLLADDISRRVAEDARVVRRIAEVSRRDYPEKLVGRILDEDLELLRGRRTDGTYAYAHYEREEAGRDSDRFAVRARDENRLDTHELSGETVYRVIVGVPSRRLLVAKNRRAFIDRVTVEYTPFEGSRVARDFEVGRWLELGESETIDLPEIAKRAKVTVHARVADGEGGPATVQITLVRARLVDDPRSPYAPAVRTLKSLRTASDERELAKVKSTSARLSDELASAPLSDVSTNIAVFPDRAAPPPRASDLEAMPHVEIYMELQRIEDLLTGTEGERRDGLDALHQLVRRLRPR